MQGTRSRRAGAVDGRGSPQFVRRMIAIVDWGRTGYEDALARQLELVRAGHNAMSGGSSESEVNDWAAKPAGTPASEPVAITTPEQNCPSVVRN